MTFVQTSYLWESLNSWIWLVASLLGLPAFITLGAKLPATRRFSLLLAGGCLLTALSTGGQIIMQNHEAFGWPVHTWRAIFVTRASCQSLAALLLLSGSLALYSFLIPAPSKGNS